MNFQLQTLSTTSHPASGLNLRISFAGARQEAVLEPFNRLDTSINYFIGNDPGKWETNVPAWGGVRYVDLYPGIDLELGSENGALTQRLVAGAGADLEQVKLQVEGAEALTLETDRLLISTSLGDYSLPLLQVQSAEAASLPSPVLDGNQVLAPFGAAQVAAADVQAQSSVVELVYATYLGGSTTGLGYPEEEGSAIAVDSSGAAYIHGITWSSDFPTTPGAFDPSFNGYHNDLIVTKLNPSGSALVYSTYLGGTIDEYAFGLAVDTNGAAYVTGMTSSTDFPSTPGVFDPTMNGAVDPFVVKLNPSGTGLEYSTFLGGTNSNDYGRSIAVDAAAARMSREIPIMSPTIPPLPGLSTPPGTGVIPTPSWSS